MKKVNLITPIEQRMFLNFLNDTLSEIDTMYGNLILG